MMPAKKIAIRLLISMILIVSLGTVGKAQSGEKEITRILFMLDASQSMSNRWGQLEKMASAKKILSDIVDSLNDLKSVEMGLRVYGHQSSFSARNCQDSRLEVPFAEKNANRIKERVAKIEPKGITPIAYSLKQTEIDFSGSVNTRNVVIIITDGEESCSGDPCEVSAALQRNNVILKPFVIGLGLASDIQKRLDCVGSYYDAQTPADFRKVLKQIIINVLDKTTVQVNLLDENGKATETDANMSFYYPTTGVAQYNYYHTINARGLPDTLDVDPINKYQLRIHTIPPIDTDVLNIEPNRHNEYDIPAAQGYLKLEMIGVDEGSSSPIQCVITKAGGEVTTYVQPMNSVERYLTGLYNIDILTLPRMELKNVSIDQSQTTTLTIPRSGRLTIQSNNELFGGIFMLENNRLKKIYTLNDRVLNETIAIQPGSYTIMYRNKYTNDMDATKTKEITIGSGESKMIRLL